MVLGVKICGVTRAEDARCAVEAGADRVGVIFAGGPRERTVAEAQEIVRAVGGRAQVVGVFARQTPAEIARIAAAAGLDAVQLHADPAPDQVREVRALFAGEVWAALRLGETMELTDAAPLFDAADAVVLEPRSGAALGGTGHRLAWDALGPRLGPLRGRRARLVLAGGLRADDVAEAVRLVTPDVVDVSSGVETGPGIKDHDQIRAFVANARSAASAAAR